MKKIISLFLIFFSASAFADWPSVVANSIAGNPAALNSVAITGSQTITALATPAAPTGTPSTTGGTIPASTTNYATIVALDGMGTVTGTQSVAVVTTGITSSIQWVGIPVTGAVSYQFWFTTTSGTYTNYFSSSLPSFTQTVPASGGIAGTLPTGNSTGQLQIGGAYLKFIYNSGYSLICNMILPTCNLTSYALASSTSYTLLSAQTADALAIGGVNILYVDNTGATITGKMAASGQVTSNSKNVLTVNDTQSGQPCVAITVGASPFPYTAIYRGNVTINGGTVSSVTLTRASVVVWSSAASGIIIPVNSGDLITTTYTVAPTSMYQCSN